jgi:hypothetical protein
MIPPHPSLSDLQRSLDSAVRAYEIARFVKKPVDEEEVRRAVDQCATLRQQLTEAKNERHPVSL